MSNADADLDFELITTDGQLSEAPALRNQKVILPGWLSKRGKPSGFLVWELSASGYVDYIESGRIYKNETLLRYDPKDEDIRLLAHTVRDQHGNRVWGTIAAAKQRLGPLGKANMDLLLAAANKVNSAQAQDSEGNSEPTPSDSSPTT